MIDILMATYNGAKFLAEQIGSLKKQTISDWRLLIHDDGSTDGTVEIIKEFQNEDPRIVFIEDNIKFGSAGQNFMHLLKHSTSEFLMFCDQDDIWLENKIQKHLLIISALNEAAMVYSNGYTFSESGINKVKFITYHRNNIQNSLFLNGGIHGCCTMFNRLLLEKVKFSYPDYVFMHDHFITILAATFGKIYYLDEPLMLYRQHDSNVTGNINTSKISIIRTFLNPENPVVEERHYKANASFFEKYKRYMTKENEILFKEYLRFPKVNLFDRIRIVMGNSFKVKNIKNLFIKTIIRKPI